MKLLTNSSLYSYPAEKVLQSMYGQFLDTLDAKSIIGYLFGAGLITRDIKQQISSSTTKNGNEILLDHLYDTATEESLASFAAVVSSDKVCSKKVQQLGKELQQKLSHLKEGAKERCVTPCCAFISLHCFVLYNA